MSTIGSLAIYTSNGSVVFDIVNLDTHFLLCPKDLEDRGMYYNKVIDKVTSLDSSICVQVTCQFGHPLLLWKESLFRQISSSLVDSCYFITPELNCLHRWFRHPSVRKLNALLEQSGYSVEKKALEELTKLGHQCQMNARAPGRFKFNLRFDSVQFNSNIYIDIMYLDIGNSKSLVLHVIDEATAFSAARCIKSVSAKTALDALRLYRIDLYQGPPDLIMHDAGIAFTSQEFRQNAANMAVLTKCVPVEAHWSFGMVGRARALLRRAYSVISADTNATRELCLHRHGWIKLL